MKKGNFKPSALQKAEKIFSSEDSRNRSVNSPLGFVSLDMLRNYNSQGVDEQIDTYQTMGLRTSLDNEVNRKARERQMGRLRTTAYTGLGDTNFSNTKAGDFNKYGKQQLYTKASDLNGGIGVFGGMAVEGFNPFNRFEKPDEISFRQGQTNYRDSLRAQTTMGQADPGAGRRPYGNKFATDRNKRLSGMTERSIFRSNNMFDGMGFSEDRWRGLSGPQTLNTLHGVNRFDGNYDPFDKSNRAYGLYHFGKSGRYRNNQFNIPYWADQETGAQPNMF